jgi:prevent-host-death family protein
MTLIDIRRAKTHLSRLVERAAAGEEIIIAKAGKPLAKLIRYEPEQTVKRKPGFWRGRVKMAEDFDTLPEEVAAAFRGERP